VKIGIGTAIRMGPFLSLNRSREKAMQLTAIGLAAGLALASTSAFAMGGGGSGGGSGVGGTYTSNPAECGGLVCFVKPPSGPAVRDPRHKRVRGASARLRRSMPISWAR
jgi:hypothetical protein